MTTTEVYVSDLAAILNPLHFFDRPEDCHQWRFDTSDDYRGWFSEGWQRCTKNRLEDKPGVLHPDVYWWLRENIGFAVHEASERDRYYYPGEKLPTSEPMRFTHGVDSFIQRKTTDEIIFNKPIAKAAFQKRFADWDNGWNLIYRSGFLSPNYNKRDDEKCALFDFLRANKVTAVASHSGTHHINGFDHPSFSAMSSALTKRRFYCITDENLDDARVMFSLANDQSHAVFISREDLERPEYSNKHRYHERYGSR